MSSEGVTSHPVRVEVNGRWREGAVEAAADPGVLRKEIVRLADEMMLLAPNSGPLHAPVEAARVVYVQEALRCRHPGAPPTVVDYASLRRRAPAAGEESSDNKDASVDVDAPAGAAVVCFPLKPKPHEIEHEAPTLFRRWQGKHPCPEPPTF
jgi:hypothetical protein